MALDTLPGPELYDARARSQSPCMLYNLDRYAQAASVAAIGSIRSST